MNTKEIESKLYSLDKAINKAYNSLEHTTAFSVYHDVMHCQKDAANETLNEGLYYLEKEDKASARDSMEDLERCLKYCKGVLKVQSAMKELIEPIYG